MECRASCYRALALFKIIKKIHKARKNMGNILKWILDNLENVSKLIDIFILMVPGFLVIYNTLNFSNDRIEYGLDDLKEQHKKRWFMSVKKSIFEILGSILFICMCIVASLLLKQDKAILLFIAITFIVFSIVTFFSFYKTGRKICFCVIVVLIVVSLVLLGITDNENKNIIVVILLVLLYLIVYLYLVPLIESSKRINVKKNSNERYKKNNISRITFLKKLGFILLYTGISIILWIAYNSLSVENSSDKLNSTNISVTKENNSIEANKLEDIKIVESETDSDNAKETKNDENEADLDNIEDAQNRGNDLSNEKSCRSVFITLFCIISIIFSITIFEINIKYYDQMSNVALIYFKHKNKKIYIYKKINDKFLCGNKDYLKWDTVEFDDRLKCIHNKMKKKYGNDKFSNYMDKLFLFSGYIRVDIGEGKRYFDKLEKYISNTNNANIVSNEITNNDMEVLLKKLMI